MKRPFAVIGFTYLLALVGASYLNVGACAALGVFCAVCAVAAGLCLSFFRYRAELASVFLSAAVALFSFCLVYHFSYVPAASLAGSRAELSGTIADAPAHSGSHYDYTVRTDCVKAGGKTLALRTKIRVRFDEKLDASPCDKVTVRAQLSLPQDEGGLGGRAYYRSKGITLFADPQGEAAVTSQKGKYPPYYYAILLREYLSSRIRSYVWGMQGALTSGILIGDVSGLPDWVKNDFTSTGISHILAVSGTQTSLISQCCLLLFCALRLSKRTAAAVSAAIVTIFMAVTGFSPSVMRAGIMCLLFLGGLMVKRQTDALNSLGLSVLLLCLPNPFAAADVGLLLSFSATLGMVLISGRLNAFFSRKMQLLPRWAGKTLQAPAALLCETTGATILTLPVILLTFKQLSLVTLLSNIVEVPLSLFATVGAAVLVLLPPEALFDLLAKPVALLLRLTAALMIGYAHLIAGIPYANISTAYGFVGILLLFAFSAAAVFLLFRNKGASVRVCAVCLCFATAVGVASYSAAARDVLEITGVYGSYGGSTVLICGGSALVFDLSGSGSDYSAKQYLKTRNVTRIDALILPSFNQKKADRAGSLRSSFRIGTVYIPSVYSGDKYPAAVCVKNAQTFLWKGVKLTLIPDNTGKNLIVKAQYGGSTAVLAGVSVGTGTYQSGGLSAGLLCFGGKIGTDFAKAVSPGYAEQGVGSGAAFSGAILENSGCRVRQPGDSGVIRALTRGNGDFLFQIS